MNFPPLRTDSLLSDYRTNEVERRFDDAASTTDEYNDDTGRFTQQLARTSSTSSTNQHHHRQVSIIGTRSSTTTSTPTTPIIHIKRRELMGKPPNSTTTTNRSSNVERNQDDLEMSTTTSNAYDVDQLQASTTETGSSVLELRSEFSTTSDDSPTPATTTTSTMEDSFSFFSTLWKGLRNRHESTINSINNRSQNDSLTTKSIKNDLVPDQEEVVEILKVEKERYSFPTSGTVQSGKRPKYSNSIDAYTSKNVFEDKSEATHGGVSGKGKEESDFHFQRSSVSSGEIASRTHLPPSSSIQWNGRRRVKFGTPRPTRPSSSTTPACGRSNSVRFAPLPSPLSTSTPLKSCLRQQKPDLVQPTSTQREKLTIKRPHSTVDAILLGTQGSEVVTRFNSERKKKKPKKDQLEDAIEPEGEMNERQRIKYLETRLRMVERENEELRKGKELSKRLAEQAIEERRKRDAESPLSRRHSGKTYSTFTSTGSPSPAGPSAGDDNHIESLQDQKDAAMETLRQARSALRTSPHRHRRSNTALSISAAISLPITTEQVSIDISVLQSNSTTEKAPTTNSCRIPSPKKLRNTIKRKIGIDPANSTNPIRTSPFSDVQQPMVLNSKQARPRPMIRLRPSFNGGQIPMRPPRPAEGDLFSFDRATTTVFEPEFVRSKTMNAILEKFEDFDTKNFHDLDKLDTDHQPPPGNDQHFRSWRGFSFLECESSSSETQGTTISTTSSTHTTSWDSLPDSRSISTCDTTPLDSRFSNASSDLVDPGHSQLPSHCLTLRQGSTQQTAYIGDDYAHHQHRRDSERFSLPRPNQSPLSIPTSPWMKRQAHDSTTSLMSVGPSATAFVLRGTGSMVTLSDLEKAD